MSPARELAGRLEAGLLALELASTPGQREALLAFLELLLKWGATYNLTAVRDPAAALGLHVLDSLSVHPFLEGETILDVGTGAGLPGIPLAVFNPRRHFVLLDASTKKIRFVRQAAIALGLRQVEVVATRVEEYRPARRFDTVLTRAFASLSVIRERTAGLVTPGGRILALKGRLPRDEIGELDDRADLHVHRLAIPGVAAERHLIVMKG